MLTESPTPFLPLAMTICMMLPVHKMNGLTGRNGVYLAAKVGVLIIYSYFSGRSHNKVTSEVLRSCTEGMFLTTTRGFVLCYDEPQKRLLLEPFLLDWCMTVDAITPKGMSYGSLAPYPKEEVNVAS